MNEIRIDTFRDLPVLRKTPSLRSLPDSIQTLVLDQFGDRQLSHDLTKEIRMFLETVIPGCTVIVDPMRPLTQFIPPYYDVMIKFDDPKYETMYVLKWSE